MIGKTTHKENKMLKQNKIFNLHITTKTELPPPQKNKKKKQ